jgi:hypothetical protein
MGDDVVLGDISKDSDHRVKVRQCFCTVKRIVGDCVLALDLFADRPDALLTFFDDMYEKSGSFSTAGRLSISFCLVLVTVQLASERAVRIRAS